MGNRVQFHIKNMTCGGCAKAVEKVVAVLDPAAKIAANVVDRSIQVETTASSDAVLQQLLNAGWEARAVE
ncbi:heavy-metal-associated domain-containing protein [Hyphomicrobium sp. D-2]|uniref:heavy-metal-associated domain-containing protein n=1 Tax=Hyphomicrobium sp. D-2 TaxID=3041621 RepID=UPI002455542F|nr:heavy-metal-associated domain-containing protein [Hyphomicrobium sp. D-2]MDH4981032.1 heavy-metal-associated domain-containing protein [Hyphomicrobium sp. D-2]